MTTVKSKQRTPLRLCISCACSRYRDERNDGPIGLFCLLAPVSPNTRRCGKAERVRFNGTCMHWQSRDAKRYY